MTDKWMETAQVESCREIAPGIFDLVLRTENIAEAAKPGQFVSVYSGDSARLLPRPISVCGTDGKLLRLVFRTVGKGTAEFSRKRPGESLQVLGPLGSGYPLEAADGKQIVLTGGGIGIPPLLYAARRLRERKDAGDGPLEIRAVLGYRDGNAFLADEFAKYAKVSIASEDGSLGTKGNVINAMEAEGISPDVFFACGPAPMLRALKEKAAAEEKECWLSLEERMACGVGACLSCVCKTTAEDAHSKVNNTRVCREGPVFAAEDVII